jgi:hypothetical protein
MAIEIVSFPIKNGGSFHSYVKLPEGTPHELDTSTWPKTIRFKMWLHLFWVNDPGFKTRPHAIEQRINVSQIGLPF